jgi:hypothetical protein
MKTRLTRENVLGTSSNRKYHNFAVSYGVDRTVTWPIAQPDWHLTQLKFEVAIFIRETKPLRHFRESRNLTEDGFFKLDRLTH